MALRPAPSALGRIRRSPDDFILTLREYDDEAKAVEGLVLAGETIFGLFEGDIRSVGTPIPTPEGVLMMVSSSDASRWVQQGGCWR